LGQGARHDAVDHAVPDLHGVLLVLGFGFDAEPLEQFLVVGLRTRAAHDARVHTRDAPHS
jgi:hypothetical protein